MTSEKKQEFTLKITQANKCQLIAILYEMTLVYIDEAKKAFTKEDRKEFRLALTRARSCINELMTSLNFEYELAINILQLYVFVNKEIARAEVKMDIEHLDNAANVIRKLLKAYQELSLLDNSPPLMKNTQAIYTGLTYDRTHALDSLSHNINRGYRA